MCGTGGGTGGASCWFGGDAFSQPANDAASRSTTAEIMTDFDESIFMQADSEIWKNEILDSIDRGFLSGIPALAARCRQDAGGLAC